MSIVIQETTSFVTAFKAFPFIKSLDAYYPDIEFWYVNKVVPGIVLGNDKLLVASENDNIVGIALGKNGEQETKLRCVRVHPDYQHSGLGIRLIDRMLDTLEVEKPIATVSEEMINLYSRAFVKRYGFSLSDVTKGEYRPRKLEYVFNG